MAVGIVLLIASIPGLVITAFSLRVPSSIDVRALLGYIAAFVVGTALTMHGIRHSSRRYSIRMFPAAGTIRIMCDALFKNTGPPMESLYEDASLRVVQLSGFGKHGGLVWSGVAVCLHVATQDAMFILHCSTGRQSSMDYAAKLSEQCGLKVLSGDPVQVRDVRRSN